MDEIGLNKTLTVRSSSWRGDTPTFNSFWCTTLKNLLENYSMTTWWTSGGIPMRISSKLTTDLTTDTSGNHFSHIVLWITQSHQQIQTNMKGYYCQSSCNRSRCEALCRSRTKAHTCCCKWWPWQACLTRVKEMGNNLKRSTLSCKYSNTFFLIEISGILTYLQMKQS